MPTAILIVDAERRPLSANAAARALLDERRGVELERGCVRFVDPDFERAFVARVDGFAASPPPPDGVREACLVCRGRSNGAPPFYVLLSPLDPIASDVGCAAVVVTFVDGARAQPSLDALAVSRSLGLSAAEARVAIGIAGGDTPDDVARAHGVGLSTVRTQLKSIYRKLGVRRQAELALRLVCDPSLDPARELVVVGGAVRGAMRS